MKDHFEYKGYLGSAEVDTDDGLLVGRLLFLRDVVNYSAASVQELEAAFRDAVDDYLETCREIGDEPDTPCKGTFNVRVGPDLHRQVAIAARREGLSLNEFVRTAIDAALASCRTVKHVHTHELIVSTGEVTTGVAVATDSAFSGWPSSGALENFGGKQAAN